MLTINLEESDSFAAWMSVSDVEDLEPKIVDGKGGFIVNVACLGLKFKAGKKGKGNLLNVVAQSPEPEAHVLNVRCPDRNGIQKCFFFLWWEENRRTWRKSLGAKRTNNKLNPLETLSTEKEPGSQRWDWGERISTAPPVLPSCATRAPLMCHPCSPEVL